MSVDEQVHVANGTEEPLISFGVVADVQYADIDNKQNYEKTAWRYYRRSIHVLSKAIDKWNSSPQPIDFVLQLGDLIDGFNTLSNSSENALKLTLETLGEFKGPGGVHHTWGNHEFYNFDRDVLMKSPMNSNPALDADCSYYSFCPVQGLRVVVLDTYDTALLGFKPDTAEYKEALALVQKHNKNEDLNSPRGLQGEERRFAKINGGLSKKQLSWLEDTLAQADQQDEHVIAMGHNPVFEYSCNPFCLAWNYDEVLATFHRHKCVRLYLAGHDHDGGYGVDHRRIHHVTLRGLVEAGEGEDPTVTGHVYSGHIDLYNLGPKSGIIEHIRVPL